MVRLVHGEGEEKRLNEDRRFGLVVWTGGNILYSKGGELGALQIETPDAGRCL